MGIRKIEEIDSSSKGGIYEVSFVDHPKMVLYANTSSGVSKLYEIAPNK